MIVSRFLRIVAALATLVLGGPSLQAQDSPPGPAPRGYPRFEMAVLAGYRFEGTFTLLGAAPYPRVEIDNTVTYGFMFGYNLNPNYEAEIQYSYASPAATAIARIPGDPNRSFDIGLHEIQLGFLGYLSSPTQRVRLYLELLLGATILNTNQDLGGTAKFTPGISVGVKAYLSDHVGLRAEARYVPMYLYTTGTGTLLCFDYGGCWDTGDRYLQQADLRAGATFRF